MHKIGRVPIGDFRRPFRRSSEVRLNGEPEVRFYLLLEVQGSLLSSMMAMMHWTFASHTTSAHIHLLPQSNDCSHGPSIHHVTISMFLCVSLSDQANAAQAHCRSIHAHPRSLAQRRVTARNRVSQGHPEAHRIASYSFSKRRQRNRCCQSAP